MLLLVVVALTSLAAGFAAVRLCSVPSSVIPAVFAAMLECLGLAVMFLILNVGAASLVIAGARTVGISFISAYVAGDAVWLAMSSLQALTFRLWWALAWSGAGRA